MPFEKKSKRTEEVVEAGFKIDPTRTYEFELVGPEIPPYKTIPRNIKIWDEETQSIRTIRYSRTEKSPFLDQQGKEIPEEMDIAFSKGKLYVQGTNAALINFLLAHDGLKGKATINPDNERFRNTFKMINPDERIINELEGRKLVAKAMSIIDNADIEDLSKFMLSQFNFNPSSLQNVTKKNEAIENEAYTRAQSTPKIFIDDFKNMRHEYKATMVYAFQDGLLDDSVDGEVHWKESQTVAYTYDPAKFNRSTDALTAWILETDAGKKFYSDIKTKLEAE